MKTRQEILALVFLYCVYAAALVVTALDVFYWRP
jgi:hypothetical protein